MNSGTGKFAVVGGTPEPIGGVTNFVYRLCHHFQGQIAILYDLYPGEPKWTLEHVPHEIRPRGLFATGMWIWRCRKVLADSNVYFNFSRVRALLLLALLPKGLGSHWIVTLHHGELGSHRMPARLLQWTIMRLVRSKIDRFGVIGKKQDEFYAENGISSDARFAITSYLPYVDPPKASRLDNSALKKRLEQLKRNGALIVASGYATAIYRHDWVVEYLNEMESDISVAICLYGPDRLEMVSQLNAVCRKPDRFVLFEGLSPDEFHEVLKAAAIYVRPTAVDSFGIAVAEALALGKPVVASNACQRPAGAVIVDKSDKKIFFDVLSKILKEHVSHKFDNTGDIDNIKSLLNLQTQIQRQYIR
jgi:glycosyltransferase involved in cell wall biosynthesis